MKAFLDARSIDIWTHGVGRYARELATRLPAARPDWEWTILRYGPDKKAVEGNITTLWRDIYILNYPREQQLLNLVLQEAKPQLIHSLWFSAPENYPCPKLLTVQDAIAQRGYPEFTSDYALKQNLWYRRTCLAVDHIIVPSQFSLRDVATYCSVPPNRMTVIPHAVSDVFTRVNPAQIADCRKRFNLPERYIFCSAHAATSYKNTDLVPQAMRLLQGQDLPLPPLLSTGVNKPHSTPEWIQLPVLPETDLAAILAGALFMVYPSRIEGFGFPVLEAMTCGVPVICSNGGSLPEVGGEAVLYFDPSSPHELAASIRTLLQGEKARKHLRELGLARAALFSWNKAIAATLATYDEVVRLPTVNISLYTDWEKIAGDLLPPVSNVPQYRRQFLHHAWQLLAAGDRDRAQYMLECENKAFPHDPDTIRELGKIYKSHGRIADAAILFREMLQVAREMNATDHLRSATYHMAECQLRAGNPGAAITLLQECLAACPTHEAAKKLLHEAMQAKA